MPFSKAQKKKPKKSYAGEIAPAVYIQHDELAKFIEDAKSHDQEELIDRDYINDETGEVLGEPGDTWADVVNRLDSNYYIEHTFDDHDTEIDHEPFFDEDEEDFDSFSEFQKAASEYAQNAADSLEDLVDENGGDPESYAYDLAESFMFEHHTEIRTWMIDMGMSRHELQRSVAELIANAYSNRKTMN